MGRAGLVATRHSRPTSKGPFRYLALATTTAEEDIIDSSNQDQFFLSKLTGLYWF